MKRNTTNPQSQVYEDNDCEDYPTEQPTDFGKRFWRGFRIAVACAAAMWLTIFFILYFLPK